ncbi:MAG: LytTR family transcriptional regulator DNA-binding domain-containing protein [Lachnospiraceae bacterium]|nr:LytTR family transcriptional regulator DNA-binding domain-containing protein [Lachnospiraceae bacterium]
MRTEIKRDSEDLRVEIHCRDITGEVSKLKRYIEKYGTGITANEDGSTCIVSTDEILYVESVDKRTFIYTETKVLSTDKRLYELEEILDRHDFFRCSKSVIINITKVVRIKPEISRTILATLSNGEVIVISRRYAAELKKLIGV